MEINAANVKFFVGSQVSATEEWMRKNKLGELSTKEIHETADNAVPVTTKRS